MSACKGLPHLGYVHISFRLMIQFSFLLPLTTLFYRMLKWWSPPCPEAAAEKKKGVTKRNLKLR